MWIQRNQEKIPTFDAFFEEDTRQTILTSNPKGLAKWVRESLKNLFLKRLQVQIPWRPKIPNLGGPLEVRPVVNFRIPELIEVYGS